MKVILSPFTNPRLNLALEEYILNEYTQGDIVMLWRNERSVIIGKNQNAYAEIDIDFTQKNSIPVIRRITGGGAVFHDLGNVNFTFISDYKEGDFGSYKAFAKPVCDYLKTVGLTAVVSGRNDIEADGFKISGNAQTVVKNRILQHGTLLYSADLKSLSAALKPKPQKLSTKGISSVRSRVENIKNLANCSLSTEEFLKQLYNFFLSLPDAEKKELSKTDIDAAKALCIERYEKFEWNFGFSPEFSLVKEKKFESANVEIHLQIKNGTILQAKIFGDFFGILPVSELENTIVGAKFISSDVLEKIKELPIPDYISGLSHDDFLSLLF